MRLKPSPPCRYFIWRLRYMAGSWLGLISLMALIALIAFGPWCFRSPRGRGGDERPVSRLFKAVQDRSRIIGTRRFVSRYTFASGRKASGDQWSRAMFPGLLSYDRDSGRGDPAMVIQLSVVVFAA